MMQKRWFKIFIWFIASFFFFLGAGVVISILKPGPTEAEVMKFMTGMMSAMDGSMMGVAMNIENDGALMKLILMSTSLTLPIMFISVLIGLFIRFAKRGGRNV